MTPIECGQHLAVVIGAASPEQTEQAARILAAVEFEVAA